MADETNTQTEGGKPPAEKLAAQPKADPVSDQGERQDPMMSRLVAAERDRDAARKEAEQLRSRNKQYERESRKGAILGALYSEFPGLPAAEVRGAALVAADDGVVDLYGEDQKAAVDKLKEILAAKAKETGSRTTPSLGGTPGTPGKSPAATPRFLI